MTGKKEKTSAEDTLDKKPDFSLDGDLDDLFKEAVDALEKTKEIEESELAVSAGDDGEEEILWEEPELEGDPTGEHSTMQSQAALQEQLVAASAELERLKEEKETAEQERKKAYDQFVRVSAEFDNYRKRTQREKEELKRFGHKDVMADFLDVADNFERALSTLADADDSIREGITMVHKQLVDILARHGVKRFESKGEAFDYTRHQAISVFETAEFPPQIVHEAFKEGYTFHDQLLRPAMVVVTKAPPQEATSEADAEVSSSEEKSSQEPSSSAELPSQDAVAEGEA